MHVARLNASQLGRLRLDIIESDFWGFHDGSRAELGA